MSDNGKPDIDIEMGNVTPNIGGMLAPNGYIRIAVGYDLVNMAWYMDGAAARMLSNRLVGYADAYDELWAEINSADSDTSILDVNDLASPEETSVEAAEFDSDVVDEIEVDSNRDKFE